ncbi:hypothetical protein PPTG_21626 [Phytophthora nicotianae INRA-310]|uniref:Uncharacterized protein n=1 Tax=Phytophthora nicotianae (strain INRA-310) TaxID=761204 RepID=W2QW58_PHYN3|nr:hypothetical protein PPTG_21626 [Phytophthora nicotianae INRA-310]ETN17166.1 hypothetical protein PPTG_21626 [Phytophthora nicotianae INRA-310]
MSKIEQAFEFSRLRKVHLLSHAEDACRAFLLSSTVQGILPEAVREGNTLLLKRLFATPTTKTRPASH